MNNKVGVTWRLCQRQAELESGTGDAARPVTAALLRGEYPGANFAFRFGEQGVDQTEFQSSRRLTWFIVSIERNKLHHDNVVARLVVLIQSTAR